MSSGMPVGPLQRATATVGMLGVTPIAVMLAFGSITPQEAAVRAVLVLIAVTIVGRIVHVVLRTLLRRVESSPPLALSTEPDMRSADISSSST